MSLYTLDTRIISLNFVLREIRGISSLVFDFMRDCGGTTFQSKGGGGPYLPRDSQRNEINFAQ